MDEIKDESLDSFLDSGEVSSVFQSLSNKLYGIDTIDGVTVKNFELNTYEMMFIVRPILNMTSANLQNDRILSNLVTNKSNTIGSYIRHVLDYRLQRREKTVPSMLDNQLPFFSIFTNEMDNISGWPDNILPMYKTEPGKMGEEYIQPDGNTDYNGKFDLQVKFKKVPGKIIQRIISTWVRVMSLQVKGDVAPYRADTVNGHRNYDSRVYVLELDASKRIVQGIAATGISIPTVDATGSGFDFSKSEANNMKEFTVKFESSGAYYNDPISIQEFNMTSAITNREVMKLLTGEDHNLFQIPPDLLKYARHRGIPLIDTSTMELTWWINKNSQTYIKHFKDDADE